MASNSNAQDGFYQVRSVSLPSRSHPLALRFEEDLNELKQWISSATSTSPTSLEIIQEALRYLAQVYDAVGNLLLMPGVQTAVGGCKGDKWVAEELDFSVKLLDVCSNAREALSTIGENILCLQSALRTRGLFEDSTLEERARGYLFCRKNACRNLHNCCAKALKQMGRKRAAREMAATGDPDLSLVVRALQEVRTSAEVVFDLVVSTCLRPKSPGWKLEWKKRKTPSTHEMGELDLAIHDLLSGSRSRSCSKDFDVGEVQRKLEIVAVGIREVEIGLQSSFKRLIGNRVVLLNILNQ